MCGNIIAAGKNNTIIRFIPKLMIICMNGANLLYDVSLINIKFDQPIEAKTKSELLSHMR
jgi:hypothetical protein